MSDSKWHHHDTEAMTLCDAEGRAVVSTDSQHFGRAANENRAYRLLALHSAAPTAKELAEAVLLGDKSQETWICVRQIARKYLEMTKEGA